MKPRRSTVWAGGFFFALIRSLNFRAMGNHARCEKCFGHCAFACQSEFWKLPVPFSKWYFGIGVQPILQCVEIINRNPTFTKAIDEMFHEVGRRLPNLRHSGTVYGTRSFEALRSGDGVRLRSWCP